MSRYIDTTAVTLKPFATWQKVDRGWHCVYSTSDAFLNRNLSDEEFDRRYPVAGRR